MGSESGCPSPCGKDRAAGGPHRGGIKEFKGQSDPVVCRPSLGGLRSQEEARERASPTFYIRAFRLGNVGDKARNIHINTASLCSLCPALLQKKPVLPAPVYASYWDPRSTEKET